MTPTPVPIPNAVATQVIVVPEMALSNGAAKKIKPQFTCSISSCEIVFFLFFYLFLIAL
jgi:hypothetical protein